MFRGKFRSNVDIKDIKATLKSRIINAQRAIAQKISSNVASAVKNKIPTNTKWLKIYHNAINFYESEDGLDFAVAGLSNNPLFVHPASTSLVKFVPNSELAGVLVTYQPWPIDIIPVGRYPGVIAVVRNSSEAAVKSRRSEIVPQLEAIKQELKDYGWTADTDMSLNDVYTDIKFLAHALETGADGHQQIKHWGPVAGILPTKAVSWAKSASREINSAMLGNDIPPKNVISSKEIEVLKKIRFATWC